MTTSSSISTCGCELSPLYAKQSVHVCFLTQNQMKVGTDEIIYGVEVDVMHMTSLALHARRSSTLRGCSSGSNRPILI